jgi:hypothetical protein
MIVGMARTILIGLLAALVLVPAAAAVPPTLGAVTQTGGKVTASWTLPAGGQVWTVEIANAAAVDSDGYFVAASVLDTDVFVDTRTTWTSDEALPAGAYYVHVSGWDKNCGACPVPEWSAVRSVTVTAGGAPTSAATTTTAPASTPATTPTAATAPTTAAAPPTATSTPAATQAAPTASAAPVVSGSGTVSGASARLKGSVAQVAFRVCGDGSVDVKILARRGTQIRTTVVTLPLAGACVAYRLGVTVPKGAGIATLAVDGATVKL